MTYPGDRSRKEYILAVVDDCVTDLLYYDRKEDDYLPRGAIEEAIKSGEITVDEIVASFRSHLESRI